MSDKVTVTERIYVDQKIEGVPGPGYRVLAHLPGEEISAERAAEIGVTKGGKMSKTGKANEPKAAEVSKADDEPKAADQGAVQTAEVRSGKPGTTKKS